MSSRTSASKKSPEARRKARLALLYKLGHRYRRNRRLLDPLIAAALVLAPPLLGWLRFDFWGGRHMVLGEELAFTEALKAFVVPFFVVNAVILIVTHQFGRYLCGWVCPTGVVSRWAEELEVRFRARPVLYHAILSVISLVVATGGMLWFVDLRVYLEGSALAISLTALGHIGLAGLIHYEMARWRLGFCKSVCPSGVYFAVLGQRSRTGIALTETESKSCIDCNLCVDVCPTDLDPRDMMGVAGAAPGLYFDGMSHLSRCLRCGDCVVACDAVFDKKGVPGVLSLGFDERFEDAPAGDGVREIDRPEPARIEV